MPNVLYGPVIDLLYLSKFLLLASIVILLDVSCYTDIYAKESPFPTIKGWFGATHLCLVFLISILN